VKEQTKAVMLEFPEKQDKLWNETSNDWLG